MFRKLSLCLFVLFPCILKAQQVSIASPTSASLGKYIDVPVNYHTGIPNISIPIYTIREGTIQLPISLSYHASGLKVMEQSSWVGAGFALQAGGMITRSVQGTADEWSASSSSYFRDFGYYNYLFVEGGGQVLDWNEFAAGRKDGEPDLFFFNFNGYSGKFYFRADRTPVLLPQQDIQIEPLLCIDIEGCNPSSEYIYGWTLTTPDGIKYYFGKTIGVADVDPIEKTDTYCVEQGGYTLERMPSSWYLYKIESADSNFSISLSYDPEEYSYYTLSLFPQEGVGGINLVKNIVRGVRLKEISFSTGKVEFIPEQEAREDLSSATPGTMNDYPNTQAKALGRIDISNKDTEVPGSTAFKKSFLFNYGYFEDATQLSGFLHSKESEYNLQSDKKRLKLNSIEEKSFDDAIINPPYRFHYYDEGAVPRSLSLAQDHWGFYNGAESNTHLTPSAGGNRESSWPQMRTGALSGITYPTGGFTQFEYGKHHLSYWDCNTTKGEEIGTVSAGFSGTAGPGGTISITVNSGTYFFKLESINGGQGTFHVGNKTLSIGEGSFHLDAGTYEVYCYAGQTGSGSGIMGTLWKSVTNCGYKYPLVGGLRIEKIIQNNSATELNSLVTAFEYTNEHGENTGMLFSRPNYMHLLKNRITRLATPNLFSIDGCRYTDPGTGTIASIISPASIHPMQTTQGYHYGYKQVKVVQPDGGYSIYKYKGSGITDGDVSIRSVDTHHCDPQAPEYPPVPLQHDFYRGELEYHGIFDSSNKRLKEYFYTPVFAVEEVGVPGLKVQGASGFLWAKEYEIKTAKKTKMEIEERTYNPSDPDQPPLTTITETLFNSPFHNQQTQSTVYDPRDGQVLERTQYKYSKDVGVCLNIPGCVSDYINSSQSLYSAYLGELNACGSDLTCQKNEWQEYQYDLNEARKTYTSCLVNSAINLNNYRNCLEDQYGNADNSLKPVVDLQRQFQVNAIIETSHWRNGSFLGSMFSEFREFDNNRNLVYPAAIYKINVDKPLLSSDFTAVHRISNSLIKDTKYKAEVSYAYKAGNVTEVTDRSGVITSYIWKYNNSYPVIKAAGVSYSALYTAYLDVAGDMSAIRSHPSLANALITTYSYDPLVGVTSMQDTNGLYKFYEYDKLGRLRFIKDDKNNIEEEYRYDYYKR